MYILPVIVVLIILSAFFSAAETAFTSANRIRLKYLAENGSKSAKTALAIMNRYDKCLTTILVGNNIVNITTSSLATIFCIEQISRQNGAAIATAATTVIVLIFGEITPKTIAKSHAESFCLAIGGILSFLMFILTPISAIFLLIQRLANKLFGKKNGEVSVTEKELMHIIDEIEDEGVLEEQESDLVRSALEFDETTVEEILTPRVNVVAIDVHSSVEDVEKTFLEEEYTRLPVYEKSIDHIIGFLSYKDFQKKLASNESFYIGDIINETLFVPDLMKISEVLKKMQRKKIHLAVVIDQHGGTEGIVTLEDIIEELVGEIWDENDVVTLPVKQVSENSYQVSGELSKSDFNHYFESNDIDFEIDGDFNTVGGWVYELFGRIPSVNDCIKNDEFEVKVLTMNERRIGTLLFTLYSPENSDEDEQ